MTLLLLGGTGETHKIAALCQYMGVDTIASLAGATRSPKPLPVPTRIGGFGGADGFADFISAENITAIVDSTHPFAARITRRSFDVAQMMNIPMVRFERPGWTAQAGDVWVHITAEAEAADHIQPGARVFLATGRQTLRRFENLGDAYLICRQIDPPDAPFPFANGEFLIGRPPFSQEDEEALFAKLRIDVLIVKNAGGAASRTKLDAARALGIPVLMIQRPDPCGVDMVADLDAIQRWVQQQCS